MQVCFCEEISRSSVKLKRLSMEKPQFSSPFGTASSRRGTEITLHLGMHTYEGGGSIDSDAHCIKLKQLEVSTQKRFGRRNR